MCIRNDKDTAISKSRASHKGGIMFQRLSAVFVLIFILLVLMVTNVARHAQASSSKRQGLTFEDRLAAQRAIEEVNWRRRIWPQDNRTPKPPLKEVAPDPVIR